VTKVAAADKQRQGGLVGLIVAGGAYTAVAVAMLWPVMASPRHRVLGQTDATSITWHLAWDQHAFAHFDFPFVTHHQFAPSGLNLMQQTAMPIVGAATWPAAVISGPTFAYNVAVVFALVGSALLGYIVINRFVSSRYAAAVGGLLYGFSPYMQAHTFGGHLNLTLLLCPPVLLLLLDEALRRQRLAARFCGLAIGALVAIQLLVSAEVLLSTVVVGGICVTAVAIWVRWRDRARYDLRAPYVRRALVASIVTAAVLSAVPLCVFFLGPERPPQTQRSGASTDLANVIIPTAVQRLSPTWTATVAAKFPSNVSEQNAYIGVPMLLVIGGAWVATRRELASRLGGGLAVTGFILSLGARPRIAGVHIPIPMPGLPLAIMPTFKGALPARYMGLAWLGLGLLVAAWLAQPRPRRSLRWLALTAAAVPLLPVTPPTDSLVTPAFFTQPRSVARLTGKTILILPASPIPRAYAHEWQIAAQFRFKMVNGYGLRAAHVVPSGEVDPIGVFSDLETHRGHTRAEPAAVARGLCRHGVDAVVAGPAAAPHELDLMVRVSGRSGVAEGGVLVWSDLRRQLC